MTILRLGKHKCDEKCYDAKHIGCNCICGGKNHGLGLQHALDTAQELVAELNSKVRQLNIEAAVEDETEE